ncbi:hypothetical protein [Pontibacillus sp. HMF3514]|uniref:hypothetical protein n=1 Tax=Pontibacillus sp. HMF3514 TaxID=2692425 RepID=UPI0013201542|nr:hypothetical protein [Pontibacillus sp. HMF3514]QHE52769.1 hypothetical protein GS400_12350 [Pontibacillus sp. HMF3514]
MKYHDLLNIRNIDLIGNTEPHVNSLRLFFERRKVSVTSEILELGDTSFEAKPLVTNNQLPIIQIDFEDYISYSITNESFTTWKEYENFEGNAFRIYSNSHFLDYVKAHTFASEDYPGPFKHFGMSCVDHVINVVSSSNPIITEVKREQR